MSLLIEKGKRYFVQLPGTHVISRVDVIDVRSLVIKLSSADCWTPSTWYKIDEVNFIEQDHIK